MVDEQFCDVELDCQKQKNSFFFGISKKELFEGQFVRWEFRHQVGGDKLRKENSLWSYL